MRAIAYKEAGAIDRPDSLLDIELPIPVATGRDILVEVKAVSVNPVDYKQRRSENPTDGKPKVVGYDASGIVRSVGPHASLFKPGMKSFMPARLLGRAPMLSFTS